MLNLKVIGNQLIVSQSDAKERFYSESNFLYAVKRALQAQGLDVIKIGQSGIAKDGHLISNDHILTHRKRHYSIYDSQYCIRNICKDFNTDGKVKLTISNDHSDFDRLKFIVYWQKTNDGEYSLFDKDGLLLFEKLAFWEIEQWARLHSATLREMESK